MNSQVVLRKVTAAAAHFVNLRVMAFDPIEFVLAPKYLAALLVIPCLTVVTNVSGILAGRA